MKTLIIGFLFLFVFHGGKAQTNLNIGGGYFGQNATSPGAVFEFEYEKYYSHNLSLPLKLNVGGFSDMQYNAAFIDIQKGFRIYTKSNFFFEQSLGIGIISKFYKIDPIFYYDKYGSTFRYNKGANIGLMPSVNLGAGYQFGTEETTIYNIWLRPKVYFDMNVRGIFYPYASMQAGITIKINSKN